MDEAIGEFGNKLKRGGVGLFYYAGHGVQVNGANYLLPIGAKINKESDVKYQAVDANKILDEMATANNGLNIVILDACRDNPFARSFRNATRGLAIVSSAPVGHLYFVFHQSRKCSQRRRRTQQPLHGSIDQAYAGTRADNK